MRRLFIVLVLFVAVSCSDTDDEVAVDVTTPTIEATVASTAPAEPVEAAGEVWTYTDSTGETFRVEDDDDTDFTDGVPSPVNLMNSSKDCAFLLEQATFWDEQSRSKNSEEYRANARAYAMYARDLSVRRNC